MRRFNRFTIAILAVSVFSIQSWGWGTKGHQTSEVVAAKLLPASSFAQLINNNIAAMKFLAMVPDMNWKHGAQPHPLEGQAHFFALDFYSPRGGAVPKDINAVVAKYGMDSVLKNGTAPWRVQQMSVLLVKILKSPKADPVKILQIAGTLGHYIGDVGNPLHVSKDYDGQGVGAPGLHSFFETKTVNEIPDDEFVNDIAAAAQPMLGHIPNEIPPLDAAFALAQNGHRQAKTLLADAKRLGLTPALQTKSKPIIVNTLAMSTAVLAKIWAEAYVLAGSPALPAGDVGRIPVPEYVKIDYLKNSKQIDPSGIE